MRRPVLPGDISAVARALLAEPMDRRGALCRRIFAGAALAMEHMTDSRRVHPVWGDGSLSAAARCFALADEPPLDDPDYLACTLAVLQALNRRILQ